MTRDPARPLFDLLDDDQAVKFLEAQRGREEKETVVQGSHLSVGKMTQTGGTGAEYLLRRLAKTAPEFVDRYEAGEFPSVRAAAIAAGVVVDHQAKRLAKIAQEGRRKMSAAKAGNDNAAKTKTTAVHSEQRLKSDGGRAVAREARAAEAHVSSSTMAQADQAVAVAGPVRESIHAAMTAPVGRPTETGREITQKSGQLTDRHDRAKDARIGAAALPVADLLRRYAVLKRLSPSTLKAYGFTLAHFERFLGHTPTVDDLDDEIVSTFLLWRADQPCRGRKVSAASVEKDRVSLLAVWRFGARKRLVAEFPDVGSWRVPKRVRPCYTVADLERLLAHVATLRGTRRTTEHLPAAWWWRTIILAGYQTGERKGGLLSVTWGDVDLVGCRITVRAECRKGHREDLVRPILPTLADELREHHGPADALVWPIAGNPLSVYPALQALCRQAGVAYHGFHGIRRTSGSYVARAGGDATKHLGHSSPQVTQDHYLVGEIVAAKSGLEFLPRIGE